MNETTARNIEIKKRLCRVFDRKNVQVVGGRGTAYGWVEIKVEQDRPADCACNWVTESRTWNGQTHTWTYRGQLSPVYMGENRSTYLCEKCLNLSVTTTELLKKTIFTKDIHYSHYYADDGYNTERAEVLYDIKIR